MQKEFEILPHTADLQIRAYGKDLQELFCNSLKGMFESIGPVYSDGKGTCGRSFDVTSHDLDSLLVDFLSEALALCDIHGEVYTCLEITHISETRVSGTLAGKKIKNFSEGEIKAVTHHGLKVEKQGEMWVAEILFDL
jgi:SHS2 domain-containing protein